MIMRPEQLKKYFGWYFHVWAQQTDLFLHLDQTKFYHSIPDFRHLFQSPRLYKMGKKTFWFCLFFRMTPVMIWILLHPKCLLLAFKVEITWKMLDGDLWEGPCCCRLHSNSPLVLSCRCGLEDEGHSSAWCTNCVLKERRKYIEEKERQINNKWFDK